MHETWAPALHHGTACATTEKVRSGGYASESISGEAAGTCIRPRQSFRGAPASHRTCQPNPPSGPVTSPLSVSGSSAPSPLPPAPPPAQPHGCIHPRAEQSHPTRPLPHVDLPTLACASSSYVRTTEPMARVPRSSQPHSGELSGSRSLVSSHMPSSFHQPPAAEAAEPNSTGVVPPRPSALPSASRQL